jgi:hypothetical protein
MSTAELSNTMNEAWVTEAGRTLVPSAGKGFRRSRERSQGSRRDNPSRTIKCSSSVYLAFVFTKSWMQISLDICYNIPHPWVPILQDLNPINDVNSATAPDVISNHF